MSRAYNMSVVISGPKPELDKKIIAAANEEWPFGDNWFRDFDGRLTHHARKVGALEAREMAKVLSSFLAVILAVLVSAGVALAADPPSSSISKPRTGTTQPFGSGTITSRSDGSSASTRAFGSGSITTERDKSGKTITGVTQKFGSGTITRWSDGTTTEARPFGSGSITTERDKSGKTVTGTSQKFGSGTITNRSNGSSSTTRPFGSGSIIATASRIASGDGCGRSGRDAGGRAADPQVTRIRRGVGLSDSPGLGHRESRIFSRRSVAVQSESVGRCRTDDAVGRPVRGLTVAALR